MARHKLVELVQVKRSATEIHKCSYSVLLRLALIVMMMVVMVLVFGRGVPKEIVDYADLVTEMRLVKHPFDKGIGARKGIEY